jgi:hypothetical protein
MQVKVPRSPAGPAALRALNPRRIPRPRIDPRILAIEAEASVDRESIAIRDRVAIGFRDLELGASDREVTQIRDRARDIDRRHGPVTAARAGK